MNRFEDRSAGIQWPPHAMDANRLPPKLCMASTPNHHGPTPMEQFLAEHQPIQAWTPAPNLLKPQVVADWNAMTSAAPEPDEITIEDVRKAVEHLKRQPVDMGHVMRKASAEWHMERAEMAVKYLRPASGEPMMAFLCQFRAYLAAKRHLRAVRQQMKREGLL